MSRHYDTVVIGGGPGGYAAARSLAEAGKRVAIVEEHLLGGVCLNYGCIPAKALIRSAEILAVARRGVEFGWSGKIAPDYARAVQRSRVIVAGQVAGIERMVKRGNITLIEGRGRFIDPGVIRVNDSAGGSQDITYDDCIIAAGAKPTVPAPFIRGDRIVTFREHIVDESLPETVLVVGGGPIGLEMAYVMREFGSHVTVIELADQILPREEPEVSAAVAHAFRESGIQVLTSTRASDVVEDLEGVSLTLHRSDSQEPIRVDRVLVATGFSPNSSDLGLERVDVATRDDGAILIDGLMRTSADHVYAVGDITMRLALAHVAETQGRAAARAILGGTDEVTDEMYAEMPRISYMQPQVASVGMRESLAKAQLSRVRSTVAKFSHNPMAHAKGDAEGFVKIITHGDHGEVAGAHIVGHDVGELLPELVLAMRWNLGVHEIQDAVHAHPSLSETIQDAVRGFDRNEGESA